MHHRGPGFESSHRKISLNKNVLFIRFIKEEMRLNLKMSTAQRFTNLVCCTQSLPCFVSVLRRWSRPKFYVRIWKINQQSCFHLVTGCTIFVATNYFGFRSCLVVAFGCFVAVNVKYFERCILTSEIWSQVSSKQCNQILANFRNFGKTIQVFGNLWECILYLANFWTYFGKSLMLLGKLSLL